jgi:MerR family copper efflux transcriptional regulator
VLISEFARVAGLPVDTVRFYVAKGLLTPGHSAKGGARPYQIFSGGDVTAARMIRLQQSLGYSLAEIDALNRDYRAGETSPARTVETLKTQIDRLEQRRAQLDTALDFLRRKIDWIEAGQPGDAPGLDDFLC